MSYELVYDASTMSAAPRTAIVCTGIALLVTLAWATWRRTRARPLGAGVKIAAGVTLLCAATWGLTLLEQRMIVRSAPRTVEGPIVGLWHRIDRTRRADRSWSTTHWEGFSVGDVPFVYATDAEQSYFHNGGARAIALRDGLRVRVRYVIRMDDGRTLHDIVRFERAVE